MIQNSQRVFSPCSPKRLKAAAINAHYSFALLRCALGQAVSERLLQDVLDLPRSLPGDAALLAPKFPLLPSEFPLFGSKLSHARADPSLPVAGLALQISDLSLNVAEFALQPAQIFLGCI